jgi:4-alpha-glucanotransferase
MDNEREALLSLAAQWEQHAEKLRRSFRRQFWNADRGYLYDHLNIDGSPDHQVRPNAILALWVSLDAADLEAADRSGLFVVAPARYEALLPNKWTKKIVHTAMETVVLAHGVTSLDPDDPHFHPRHLDLDRYYYDEAYHNGDVWEWLTGPMVTCMRAVGETNAAKELLLPLVDEILNRACVGSLREIRDGVDTPGKEEFGGATSQAWSLSEFIRVHVGK